MSAYEENLTLRTVLAEILHVQFYDMDEWETVDRIVAEGARAFRVLDLPAVPPHSLRARLTAFARDCTLNGDMTLAAERMMARILEETK